MIKPQTFFLGLQWAIVLAILLISLFVHRSVAIALLAVFLTWKADAKFFLPGRVLKKLSGSRLNDKTLRISMKNSPFGVHENSTQLRNLKPHWPGVLMLETKKRYIFLGPQVHRKLDRKDQAILFDWCFRLLKNKIPQYGLYFYGATSGAFRVAHFIDRWIPNKESHPFHLEKTLFSLLSLATLPLKQVQKEIYGDLIKAFSPDDVERLTRKLDGLLRSHKSPPPFPFRFLLLDSTLGIPRANQDVFGETGDLKGIHYGTTPTTGS